jgi:hypothetical protein
MRSAAGSASQKYGSEDPDLHPDPYQDVLDPYQDVTDPEHW